MIYRKSDHQWIKFRKLLIIIIPIVILFTIFISHETNKIILKSLENQSIIQTEWIKNFNSENLNTQYYEAVNSSYPIKDNFIIVPTDDNTKCYGKEEFLVQAREIKHEIQDSYKARLFGNNENYYWLVNTIKHNDKKFWLIEFFPKNHFSMIKQTIFIIWLIVIIGFTGSIYAVYRLLVNYISKPICNIDEGIQRVLDDDFTFEYHSNQISELDHLGQTVTSLKDKLIDNQKELVASEQRLSILMDHLNLGVVLIGANHEIELFNPEASFLLNLSEVSIGRSFEACIQSFVLIDMIKHVLEDSTAKNDEIELFVPKQKYIDVNIIPFQQQDDENRDEHSILVLLYDTSNIRKLEKVRSEFVANASHELRTPVTAIKGFAETLKDGAIDNKELAHKFINIIYNESNRLESLIQDILDLTRIEKKTQPIVPETFDLVQLTNETIEFLASKANSKSITLDLSSSLPEIFVQTDAGRLKQIIINLVDNAITYSNPGMPVKINICKDQKYVYIKVSDNGIGIPKEDQDRVFERFYRVDKGRSRNSGGTGLGLSIVRNLVTLLKGNIELKSEVNKGSEFTVRLPININF